MPRTGVLFMQSTMADEQAQLIVDADESKSSGFARPAKGEGPLTALHPNHMKLLRTKGIMLAVSLFIAALVLEATGRALPGAALLPIALMCLWLVWLMPKRRHRARGYDKGADRLRVVRGLLLRADTIVPYSRVQHLDVAQGPLERFYGLATLVLHTAGTHNSSVSLPGLDQRTAFDMREAIRAHIRSESL